MHENNAPSNQQFQQQPSIRHTRPPPTEDDLALFSWFCQIPRSGQRQPLSTPRLKNFFETAYVLVSKGNENMTQQVISRLATEGGLQRLAELLDSEMSNTGSTRCSEAFEDFHLPFWSVITDAQALRSRLLEKALGNIYIFLYGVGGRRSVASFTFFSRAFETRLTRDYDSLDFHKMYEWTNIILKALLKLLQCNQTASINKEFHPVVDTFQSFLDLAAHDFKDTLSEQDANASMLTIRRYLEYGHNLSSIGDQRESFAKHAVAFHLEIEGPGELSELGRRHDNDHVAIENIKILPTAGEILSQRSEYFPVSDYIKWHLPGVAGLLDRQFRLLREDTVGQLRDCVRSIIEEAAGTSRTKGGFLPNRGLKYNRFEDVQISDVFFDTRKRLQVLADFDQPAHANSKDAMGRRQWWMECRQLQVDALVCLIDSDGRHMFLCVCERGGIQNQEDEEAAQGRQTSRNWGMESQVPNLWTDKNRATVTLRLIDITQQDTIRLIGNSGAWRGVSQTLVEFPGVLLPSFKPTLEALQRMSRLPDVPFATSLAPATSASPVVGESQWPRYARQPRFAFNFEPILDGDEPLYLRRGAAFDYETLEQRSTLDKAQCRALTAALSNEFALIQGPPGTGKSYVAVQMMKILLQHRKEAQMGPIVVVCYTNHALDQILEHNVENGIKQIIRIGSRSKSEVLEPLNLRHVAMDMDHTKTEKQDYFESRKQFESRGEELESLFNDLTGADSLKSILKHLEANNEEHHRQLATSEDEEGFQMVTKRRGDNLQQWYNGTSAQAEAQGLDRSIRVLENVELFSMTHHERQRLFYHWITEIQQDIGEDLEEALQDYVEAEQKLDSSNEEVELRCLRQAHVVGVTTSDLARKIELLRALGPKVLICEEAGEILEAHTLTAFLPSIEHAILIGDHEQLRPQVQNYDLSLESHQGKKYSLDVSTFERLVTMADSIVPCETLQIQRRMDPLISDLIRMTIYPDLLDHHSVQRYPAVVGMRHKLYWLDHCEPEAAHDTTNQTSHSNDHEVALVKCMVTHLVRQGVYQSEDIVVLTPYVRQLQKIRNRLALTMEIIVSDRDTSELNKQGLLPALLRTPKSRVATHKAMLTKAVRVATVDNFQGEEAKVVIISLVRSNDEKKCGFLRTTNRINVLLR